MELASTKYTVLYQLTVQVANVLAYGLLLPRVWGRERVGEGWILRDVVKLLRRQLRNDVGNPGTSVMNQGSATRWRSGDS